jgi:hypothetical protein
VSFSEVRLRALSHATEDECRVRQALDFASGGAHVDVRVTNGHHGNRITVMESRITGRKDVDAFFARLSASRLIEELALRLDDKLGNDLWLCIRLDKQEAYAGRLANDAGGDVIHVRARAAAYPATMENARRLVGEYLSSLADKQQMEPSLRR